MPHILFAIYDPSQPSLEGSFWVVPSNGLDLSLLNAFYYDTACLVRPDDPNQIRRGEVIGGISALQTGWISVFRYINAGHDLKGRPGRFVIGAAFVSRSEIPDCDISSLFQHKFFEWIEKVAPSNCPLPAAPVFDEEIEFPTNRPSTDQIDLLLRNKSVEYKGENALQEATRVGVALPTHVEWSCFIRQPSRATIAVQELESRAAADSIFRNEPRSAEEARRTLVSSVGGETAVQSNVNRRQKTLPLESLLLVLTLLCALICFRFLATTSNMLQPQEVSVDVEVRNTDGDQRHLTREPLKNIESSIEQKGHLSSEHRRVQDTPTSIESKSDPSKQLSLEVPNRDSKVQSTNSKSGVPIHVTIWLYFVRFRLFLGIIVLILITIGIGFRLVSRTHFRSLIGMILKSSHPQNKS
jgi:hypothetical protein